MRGFKSRHTTRRSFHVDATEREAESHTNVGPYGDLRQAVSLEIVLLGCNSPSLHHRNPRPSPNRGVEARESPGRAGVAVTRIDIRTRKAIDTMGLWDGLDKAQTFEKGTFLKPGVYTLRIKTCLDKMTRKSGQAYIVEFEVLASSNSEHPVGTSVTWFQKMADRDVAFGAIKEFLAAVYQKDLRQKTEKEDFERTIAPSLPAIADASTKTNSLAGQVVNVEVTQIKTQKNLDFSRHAWSPFRQAVG